MVGRLGSARLLLKHGANPDTWNETFDNPLHTAINSDHLDMAMLLIEHGAKLDYVLNNYFTVFHALANMSEDSRAMIIAEIASRDVTPEGMFKSLKLGEIFASLEEAFDW